MPNHLFELVVAFIFTVEDNETIQGDESINLDDR